MSENLMNPSDGKLMNPTNLAVNGVYDGEKNLIVRINRGVYKKKAASGYPEVYLPYGSYPLEGTKWGSITQAVNSAVDGNKALVVRIQPGIYTENAASGYPEVWLPFGSYPYQTFSVVLVNMRAATVEAAMTPAIYDATYVSLAEYGSYAQYTFITPGTYQVYVATCVSWGGDAHIDINGQRVMTNDGTTASMVYDQTLHFDYGNTITAYCARSGYSDSRQANMFVYIRLV